VNRIGLKSDSIRLRYILERLSNLYRCGTVKDALPTLSRKTPSCVATFLMILAAPLQSALIN